MFSMTFQSFDTKNLTLQETHGFLLTSVAPRPIALVSTVDKDGNVNLAPFSNFNAFSTNPPVLVFSASRSGRTGETKDTYKNIKETMECCISIVEYAMVHQISFASTEFDRGVNEFIKAGLTPIASEIVKAPRVAESPVHFECKVTQVIELGDQGGSGNLFLCEVIKIHVNDRVMKDGKIDPLKIHQAGRCGLGYYVNNDPERMYSIAQPQAQIGIGVDALNETIRNSTVLTGNNLGQLALNQSLPTAEEIADFQSTESYKYLKGFEGEECLKQFHKAASEMLNNGNLRLALICLYSY
jgi:flavin reductase (DIM6/NTAB) family NADH-FMN oxidoreductase RutF